MANGVSPAPGFYESIVRRIEQMEQESIWIPLIYSRSSMRLAIASLGFSMILFGCVFATEWSVDNAHYAFNDGGSEMVSSSTDLNLQRDAVLVQFATYRKPN